MGQRSLIAFAAVVAVLLIGAVAGYAYDSSNDDRIANGVTVARVDVGGLSPAQARLKVKRLVADQLEQPIAVTYGGKRFNLSAEDAGLRTDVGGMVDQALEKSREGSIISRVARDLTGGEEDASIPARVSYSKAATARLVERARKGIDRPAQDAKVNFPSLSRVKEKDGVKLEVAKLRKQVETALVTPDGNRQIEAPTSVTKPKVTTAQLADRYPAVIVVERGSFKLSLYKNLKLAKTYRIAVGQVGLETPAGLYHIQNKAVNAAWSVPNSDWAGSLAGQVIPGGAPNNPLKARWMGIFNGAGIHGTDQVGSLGTAASHGCIRMAIPDVIELYDQVQVQTPVYIA